MSLLQKHPFAVSAYFTSSTVLTFAIPKDELSRMIPPCLELDTYKDQWAFIAIAMVQAKNLRPKGFPEWIGRSFFLAGYRIFVRYQNKKGKRLRGLYILKSETDKKSMAYLGNIFTNYRYDTIDILLEKNNTNTIIRSKKSGFEIEYNDQVVDPEQSENSFFSDWKTARRFAGPLPFTFSYDTEKNKVMIVEGVRQNWKPKPIKIINYKFDWLQKLNFSSIQLASAFQIKEIPYYWKKGVSETWE